MRVGSLEFILGFTWLGFFYTVLVFLYREGFGILKGFGNSKEISG